MRAVEFFETNPVFGHSEFVAAHTARGRSPLTSNNLLARHVGAGRLVRVRRGLYATVPRGVEPERVQVDPYLIASHATDDAAVAYHAALQFAGKTYSAWRRFHYLTRLRARPFRFRDLEFLPVQVPVALRSRPEWGGGIVTARHAGGQVRVTTLERTLVDVLESPAKAGGWEEVWRSLEMVSFFDLDAVTAFALARGSALAVARVGFFLEQHRESLMVTDAYLERLRQHAPRQPRYLGARRAGGTFVKGWNLVVPDDVLQRRWAEVA